MTSQYKVILTTLAFIFLTMAGCQQLATTVGLKEKDQNPYHPYIETALQEGLLKDRLVLIEIALEAYYLTYASYPVSLQELIETGLLTPKELIPPLGETFTYKRLFAVKQKTLINKATPPAYILGIKY